MAVYVLCSALALDAQAGSSDPYSNGTVAALLSLGTIAESLFYRAIFSLINFVAWLCCTDKPVAASPLAALIKDLFSVRAPGLVARVVCASRCFMGSSHARAYRYAELSPVFTPNVC